MILRAELDKIAEALAKEILFPREEIKFEHRVMAFKELRAYAAYLDKAEKEGGGGFSGHLENLDGIAAGSDLARGSNGRGAGSRPDPFAEDL